MPKGIYGNRGKDTSEKAILWRKYFREYYAKNKELYKKRRYIKMALMSQNEKNEKTKYYAVMRTIKAIKQKAINNIAKVVLSKNCVEIARKLEKEGYQVYFPNTTHVNESCIMNFTNEELIKYGFTSYIK